MQPSSLWQDDAVFIECGVQDAVVPHALRAAGFTKYLGVHRDPRRVEQLQREHPDVADHVVAAHASKTVRHNNAQVLILTGLTQLHLWSYKSVRHAESVAWTCGIGPLSVIALLGCLWHLLSGRYSVPRVVTLSTDRGKKRRLFVARILRHKVCHRNSLHFIPHQLGPAGVFREFEERGVKYTVLRWFDKLPQMRRGEDIDMLIADDSLPLALEIMNSYPGILPTDVYSEHGIDQSDYCGVPYYPPRVATRILDGAVMHKNVCRVPNPWDHFHSLAYHAVYHKGTRTNLDRGDTNLAAKEQSSHDFTGILTAMANRLGIDVEISLEGLHSYLQETGWGPAPEELARLATACHRNRWLRLLASRLPDYVHDQGLAVFVLRQSAVDWDLSDRITQMIAEGGFKILAAKPLTPAAVERGAARTRGGNWGVGPFDAGGGPPAAIVVAYDEHPIAPNRKQRRRFPQRTNARIFLKEEIRNEIIAALPKGQGFNALHSSDHAPEAWHLIEELAPELLDEVRHKLQGATPRSSHSTPLRQAA